MAKIIKKFGLEFFGTGLRVKIEDGFNIIGETNYDAKRGTQVFYFKDEADWEKHRVSVFEANYPFDKPIPFFEAEITVNDELPPPLAKPVQAELEKKEPEPVIEEKQPVQPEPADPSDPIQPPVEDTPTHPGIAEIVAIVNEGKKIRFKEIAERLGVDAELVKSIITETPQSPVTIGQGGWVSIIA